MTTQTQQLVDYIKQAQKAGISDEEIRKNLKEAGWGDYDIDNAFSELKSIAPPQPILESKTKLLGFWGLFIGSLKIYISRFWTIMGIILIPIFVSITIIFIFSKYIRFLGASKDSLYFSLLKISSLAQLNQALSPPLHDVPMVKPPYSLPPFIIPVIILFIALFIVLSIISQIGLINIILKRENRVGVLASYKVGLKLFWSYLWISILATLVILGGVLAGIVPGIIFGVWIFASQYILINEDIRGLNALIRSKFLVRGFWKQIFWRFLLFILLLIAIVFLSNFLKGVLSLIFSLAYYLILFPLIFIFGILIYENLLKIKGREFEEDKKSRRIFKIFAILSILIIPLIYIIFVGLNTARKSKLLDAKRIADLNLIRGSLEFYFLDNGFYPQDLNALTPKYLFNIPTDPETKKNYGYAFSPFDKPVKYQIWAELSEYSFYYLNNDADINSESPEWFGDKIDGSKENCSPKIKNDCIYDQGLKISK